MESGPVTAGPIDFIVCIDGLRGVVLGELQDRKTFFGAELA